MLGLFLAGGVGVPAPDLFRYDFIFFITNAITKMTTAPMMR